MMDKDKCLICDYDIDFDRKSMCWVHLTQDGHYIYLNHPVQISIPNRLKKEVK